jgi:outer membrane cobalamin receptor
MNRRTFRRAALLSSALAVLPLLSPSATSAADAPVTLPTLSVGGTAPRPELAPESPRNPFRTPSSSSAHAQTITREEIEQLRPRDVFDLLNNATGVIATQSSRKGFSGLTIRGDSNFRWIIDGAYLQPTMASRIMRSLPVSLIEEVKIVRGSSALTMGPMVGSASPGGAPVDGFIVIRTRKPAAREAQTRIAVETQGTLQTGLWGGETFKLGDGKGYVAGLASYAGTDGPDDRLNNGASYNVGRQTTSGVIKGGVDLSGWLVDVTAYADTGEFEIANANSHGSGQGSWFMDPARAALLVISGSKAWSEQQTTLFNVSRTESRQKFWTANTAAGPYSSVQNDNYVAHVNLRHNVDIDKTRLMIGGDYLYWNSPKGQQYYEGVPREERTRGAFAQVEQNLFNDKVTLDAAYRIDQVDVIRGLDYYTGGAAPYGGVNSPLRTTNKSLPIAKFYSVGGAWSFIDNWKLTLRYGEGVQSTDGLNPRPGVTLAEDRQIKWEAGVEGRIERWLNPALNFFHRTAENEKTLNGYTYQANNGSTQTCRSGAVPTSGALAPRSTSALTPCYDQADTTRSGIEVSASGAFAARSSYRASLTHFTGLKNASAITPRNIAELSVTHGVGDFTLSGAIKHVAAYKGSASDAAAWLGGYTRYDVGVGYDFALGGADVRTTLYGRNLTDERYETTNGVQDVGRVIGLEALARF